MLEYYRDFKEQYDNIKTNFKNSLFNNVIHDFEIMLILTNQIINPSIIQGIEESNIIIIDTYVSKTKEKKERKYYIACFKKYLIIFDQLDQRLTKPIFAENNKNKISCISKTQPNFIGSIFEEEISNLNERFKINSQNRSVIIFWKIIQSCLSGYLITKCYNDCNKDRLEKFKDEKIESKQFKEYEFIYLRQISAGVYLCYHIETGKFYVVKIFNNDKDNEILKHREIKNYQNINFPFVPEYFGLTSKEGFESLVIEFINGRVLDIETINQLNFEEKVTIMLEILHTTQYLHQNHYIYRDFKLNNIMLDKFKRIVILDFDRMIKKDENNQDSEFTTDFLSPFVDIALNKEGHVPQIENDIYSLGLLISTIFIENNDGMKANDILIDQIKSEICDKCLSENLNERPSIQNMINFFCTKIIENGIFSNNLLNDFIFYSKIKNSLAQTYLGIIYLNGVHVSQDIDKSIHYFELASDLKEDHAQFNLGQIYISDQYNKKDIMKAIHYYTLSADNNNPVAQNFLGVFYLDNTNIKQNANLAIKYFSKAAGQNYPEAQANLGFIYLEGKYVTRDIKNAVYYLSLAAENNDVQSQTTLGLMYSDGKYIKIDIQKSIHYFELASDNNSSDAQFNLGKIYFSGKYIKRDIKKSIHYFELAANKYHPKSLYYLGIINFTIKKDVNKAINCFTIASKLNEKNSQCALGFILIEGKHIKQDINKAIYLFTLSANQKCAIAQNNLGIIYYESKYVKRDMNKAMYYLSLAAKQNYPLALYNLGVIYLKGQYIDQNIKLAIDCFINAADQNYPQAQNDLGYIFYEGKYVPRDIDKAIYYFKLAVNQNYPQAQNDLGYIFYEGRYVTRDMDKAIYYLSLAADQNNFPLAQDNLGFIYLEGKYIKQNINKSINYFTLAANQNSPKAHMNLAMLYLEGEFVTKDIDKAIYHLTIAANCNFAFAQNNLGFIYYEGLLVPQNINKAIQYLTFASNQNNAFSQYNLGVIYYEGKYVPQNIKKALYYLDYSAKNNFRPAQLFLADLYFEGKYVKRDIDISIRLYKEVSCFNNKFAKNNLGVIFIKYKQNIVSAKEYFKEAINQKNDLLSMYNLANVLIDEEENLGINNDESIKYLLQSSCKFEPSLMLFCLLITKKHKYINLDLIKKEIEKHDIGINSFEIFEDFISNQPFSNASFVERKYQYYRNSFFIYINKKVVNFLEIIKNNEQIVNEVNDPANNINEQFYEGFGM